MTIPDSRISDPRYNKTTGYNLANNYGPAPTVDHSGMTNDALDQFYQDIAEEHAQKQAKVDGPITKGLKSLVKKVFK